MQWERGAGAAGALESQCISERGSCTYLTTGPNCDCDNDSDPVRSKDMHIKQEERLF